MNIAPVNVVVIGSGMISDAYLSTMINQFDILNVVACGSKNLVNAEKKAQQYGISARTLDDIWSDDSIELIVNLTPPEAHYPIIKQALNAGKHVYTEKVLTVDPAHARELMKLADEKQLLLGAAPDTFLGAGLQTAISAVSSGMIGEITSFSCALSRDMSVMASPDSFTIKPGGGIGFDQGVYYLTALLSLLGPVQDVSGIVQRRSPTATHYNLSHYGESFDVHSESLLSATLRFKNQAVGNMLLDGDSVFLLPEQPSMILHGTLGIMYLPDPNRFGGEVKVILKGNNEPQILQQSHPYNDESRGIGAAELAWSLRTGRTPRASKEMAYHALEVLHSIATSSETGERQTITSTFEKPAPLPRGFCGQGHFKFIEERCLATP